MVVTKYESGVRCDLFWHLQVDLISIVLHESSPYRDRNCHQYLAIIVLILGTSLNDVAVVLFTKTESLWAITFVKSIDKYDKDCCFDFGKVRMRWKMYLCISLRSLSISV